MYVKFFTKVHTNISVDHEKNISLDPALSETRITEESPINLIFREEVFLSQTDKSDTFFFDFLQHRFNLNLTKQFFTIITDLKVNHTGLPLYPLVLVLRHAR
jgi:hypothetical protein